MADLENVNKLDASLCSSHNPIINGDININQHKLSVAKPQVSRAFSTIIIKIISGNVKYFYYLAKVLSINI